MGSHSLRHKVLLPQLKMIVLILMALMTCGEGQQIPPQEKNTLILIDALDSLSLQLKEVQENVTLIIETQKTIQADIKRLQQCSTKAQLNHIQELVFKDDCEEGRSACSDMGTCTDHFNRYECSCLPGYSGDGFTCQDVDECVQGISMCGIHELCSNIPGSYTCHCQEGYRKEGDTCLDVDECSENNNICGDHSTCRNDPGNYTCTCDKYFRKVGNICKVPVCESPSVSFSNIGCLTFVKELMNWDEAKSKCQETGKRLAEGIQLRHFHALLHHYDQSEENFPLWIGLRHGQWIHQEEEEEIQQEDWLRGEPDGDLEEQCGILSLYPGDLGLADEPCKWPLYPLCQSLP